MKLNDYFALACIEAFDDDSGDTYKENLILTNVSNYTEAMELLERYYGLNIEVIHDLTLFEGPFLRVSDQTVEKIVTDEI